MFADAVGAFSPESVDALAYKLTLLFWTVTTRKSFHSATSGTKALIPDAAVMVKLGAVGAEKPDALVHTITAFVFPPLVITPPAYSRFG